MQLKKLGAIVVVITLNFVYFQTNQTYAQNYCEDCEECRKAHKDEEHEPWPFRFHYHGEAMFTYLDSTGPGYEVPSSIKVDEATIEVMGSKAYQNPSCTKHTEVSISYTSESLSSGSIELSRTDSEGGSSTSTDSSEVNYESEIAGKVWKVVDAKVNTGLTIGNVDTVGSTSSNSVSLKNSWTEERRTSETEKETFFIDPDTKMVRYRKYQILYSAKVSVEYWEDEISCKPLNGLKEDAVFTRCGTGKVTVVAKRKGDILIDQLVEALGNCTPQGGRVIVGKKQSECNGGKWTEVIDGKKIKDEDLCKDEGSSGSSDNDPPTSEGDDDTGVSVLEGRFGG